MGSPEKDLAPHAEGAWKVIIKSKMVRTGGTRAVVNYVQQLGDNEEIEFLDGSPSSFVEVDFMARLSGHKNAAIHYMISPSRELGSPGLQLVVDEIYDELGLDENAPFVLMKHTKLRQDGKTDAAHYHLVIPAADNSGRVYNIWKSKMRDEVISRVCELRLGHPVVAGAHNGFVLEQLHDQGRPEMAYELEAILNGDISPRVADYNASANHLVSRRGEKSLQEMITSFTQDLRGKQVGEIASALHAFEIQFPDVTFDVGTGGRSSRLVAYRGGKFLIGIHNQLDVKKDKITQILKLKGKYKDGKYRQGDGRDVDQGGPDRGESGRYFRSTLRRRPGQGPELIGGDAGGNFGRSDAPKTGGDRTSGNDAYGHEAIGRVEGGDGRPVGSRVSISERAVARLAARRVRLRVRRDDQPTIRVTGADLRVGSKFAARADIQEKRAEFVMQGPPATIRPVDQLLGDRAAERLKARRPLLGGRGKLRVSHRDRILGNRAAGRLTELRREHREVMSTPLNLSSSSQANQILDLDDPLLMQKLSEQLRTSLGFW